MTGNSGSTPKRPWLEAVISALSAVIVIWLGSWGYAALDRTVAAQQQLERAAALADDLAAQAGRGQAKEGATAIEKRGAEIIERVFVTDKGGVDEFGIARGGGLLVGGADLPAEVRQALLNHDKGVIAAAEQAGREKRPLAWARLTTTMEDGRRVIAVPYRLAADKAPAGVSGFILRSAPASAGNQPWVWLAPLLAAGLILLLGATRPISAGLGAAAQVLVVATVFLSAPAALTVTEATGDVVGALLFPHAGPPVNEALNTASWWLLGALLLLAGALGGGLQFLTSIARALKGDPAPYAYVGPAVVATGVLIFVPFFVGVGLSFTTADGTFVGVDNYIEVIRSFADPNSATHFTRTFIHTVIWTVMNVSAHVTIGLALALLLNRPNLRGRKLYRLLLIIPWAVPNYITALTWKWMFNTQYGPVNVILGGLGLEPVDWLGQSALTNFAANLVTNIWLGFPFMMVISLGALQSIPGELYEAAAIDGASPWQRFRHITLPLLKPALFPAVILGTIWTFNAFNVIYLVSGGGPDHQTEILITEAYYLFTVLRRIGLAAAYSVLIFILLLGYTLITNRLTSATEAVDR